MVILDGFIEGGYAGGRERARVCLPCPPPALPFEDSPSLRTLVPEAIRIAYPRAVGLPIEETGIPRNHFPAESPFSAASLLDGEHKPQP